MSGHHEDRFQPQGLRLAIRRRSEPDPAGRHFAAIANSVSQSAKFSELLQESLTRYRNRAIEAAVRSLGDQTLKQIAVELTQSLRKTITVDWVRREDVRARLRVMVRTLLRRYKYPPDRQEEATNTVLRQAETLSAEWV